MTATVRPAGQTLSVSLPAVFSFRECLVFLGRSPHECLHRVSADTVYKPLRLAGENHLLKIACADGKLTASCLNRPWNQAARTAAAAYLREWLDLGTDLAAFYRLAAGDRLLGPLTDAYHGLRLIKIPDLFEALAWAILGQQINLPYAYTLKRRLVETYGENLTWGGETWWFFPPAARIANVPPAELTALGLTRSKGEYLQAAASAVASGRIDKEALAGRELAAMRQALTALRGVGDWTADYVIMKTLHHPSALPAADAGLHQALRRLLGLARKPTVKEIHALAAAWKGWEAYATFYLWRSLYD